MMRAAPLTLMLALTACAAAPEPPRTTLIADRIIIPRDSRAEEQDWRDAAARLAAEPEQESLLLGEAIFRRVLATCIARSVKEA
jgi:hypothetical protein